MIFEKELAIYKNIDIFWVNNRFKIVLKISYIYIRLSVAGYLLNNILYKIIKMCGTFVL